MPSPGGSAAAYAYFASDFFSPYYFAPLAWTAHQPSSPVRYFAPSYFSAYYFPPLLGDDSLTPGTTPYSDQDAYTAMITALEGTGVFADVAFGTTADQRQGGADLIPAAVITPVWWSEVDDVDPSVVVRQVTFDLTLIVRDEDPFMRFKSLDRLTALAQNAIDGTDLGGGCLPALTLLRRGGYDPSPVYPEQRVVLRGEFTYLVPNLNGHSAAH
jgi:hypothetical protein